jgi:PAS domain S-box-containing protein
MAKINKKLIEFAETFSELDKDLYCLANHEGYFVELTERWPKLLGWSEDELKSKPFVDFVHPEDRQATFEESEKLAKNNSTINFVNRYLTKSGVYIYLEWNSKLHKESNLIVAKCRDVTEEYITKRQFYKVQEITQMGTWRVNIKTNTAFWDEITYNIHEVEPGTPQKVEDGINYYVPEHRPIISKCVEEGIANNKPWNVDLQIETAKGKRKWVNAVGYPVLEQGELVYIEGTFKDIDHEVKQRIKLEKTKNLALSSIKAKDRFLATMSHELRTPLNGILSISQLLLDSDIDKETREQISIINDSGINLLNILNDILDFSKIDSGMLQFDNVKTNLFKLLKNTAGLFENILKVKGVSLNLEIDKDVPEFVLIDDIRLKQVLMNLLGNAAKFTKKGSVTIKVSYDKISTQGHFEIIDTGIGVEREKLNSIFNAFYQEDNTTTRKFGGTGLGLAIVKKIVHAMGGAIRAESNKGEGATFSFEIPLKSIQEFKEAKKRNNISINDKSFKNLKVLVAEDNLMNQKVITKILEKMRIKADIVKNGEEALLKVHEENYDIILMDMQMPKMDGLEASEKIRAMGHETPIIALTANAYSEDEERCIAAGMNAFMTKPINLELLKQTLLKFSK